MTTEHQWEIGDIVRMRKQHPCGGDTWQVIRIGADFRIKCQTCGRSVMLPRKKFVRGVKEIIVSQQAQHGVN